MASTEPSPLRPLWVGGPLGRPLGVGTWAWGDEGYWGYGSSYTGEDVAGAYAASRAMGLTLFDTAEAYGRGASERILGQLIAHHGDEQAAVVATKFATVPWKSGRRGQLSDALSASLQRLRLPRIALYQLHWSIPLVDDRTWLRELAVAVDRGLIGAVGVSNYGPRRLRAAHQELAAHGVPLATNQIQYSLLHRRPERTGLVQLCRELDVTVIAYSPLAQGLLTGKYGPDRPPPGVRRLRYQRLLGRVPALIRQLEVIGAAHDDRSPAQVALNWLIARGALPIPGAKTADQARHNAAATGWSLTADEVAALDAGPPA